MSARDSLNAVTRAAWLDEMTDADFCHLGYLGEMFCGAHVGGRERHGDYDGRAVCPSCGLPTCPKCAQVADVGARLGTRK